MFLGAGNCRQAIHLMGLNWKQLNIVWKVNNKLSQKVYILIPHKAWEL